jgi:hypothetical protein
MRKDVVAPQHPIVDYLVLEDPPHLRANRCVKCDALYFDRRNACAACGSTTFDEKACRIPTQLTPEVCCRKKSDLVLGRGLGLDDEIAFVLACRRCP